MPSDVVRAARELCHANKARYAAEAEAIRSEGREASHRVNSVLELVRSDRALQQELSRFGLCPHPGSNVDTRRYLANPAVGSSLVAALRHGRGGAGSAAESTAIDLPVHSLPQR